MNVLFGYVQPHLMFQSCRPLHSNVTRWSWSTSSLNEGIILLLKFKFFIAHIPNQLGFCIGSGQSSVVKMLIQWENVHCVIYFKPQGPILSCNNKMKWFTVFTRTWNRKTMLARIMCCVNAAETLPPPSEITKVTFTTWDQEVRDEKNAFLFSLFCLRETSMFIPDWNGMFFCNIQTELVEQMETQNNQKLKNTQSCCLQEDTAVDR